MTLLIAMPTQGAVSTRTVRALIALTQWLRKRGTTFGFETYDFSDIVFSRNQLMSLFLTRTRFSHMLCVDSDMAFAPEVIGRMIGLDRDFVAAAYPQKHPVWPRIRALIESEAALPEDEKTPTGDLLARAWIYNHQLVGFDGAPWVPRRHGGFITVPATGTGLMLLSRAVPERMVETGAATPRPRMAEIPLHRGLDYHDFFSHLDADDGGLMLGEDQSFCRRWVETCRGEIWLDTRAVIHHVGQRSFSGRYAMKLDDDFAAFDDE